MKRLTSLGVAALAVAAVAGGTASPATAKVCSYNSGQYHIKKRKNVSCKTAQGVLDYYLTSGSTKKHNGWQCPNPWNDQQGKCVNKKKSASFKYKSGY
jgi:hypothetical protein